MYMCKHAHAHAHTLESGFGGIDYTMVVCSFAAFQVSISKTPCSRSRRMLLFKAGSSCLALKQKRFKRIRKKKSHCYLTGDCLQTTGSAKRDQPLYIKHCFPFPPPYPLPPALMPAENICILTLFIESKVLPRFHTIFMAFRCQQSWVWLWEANKGKVCSTCLPCVLALSLISLRKTGRTVSEILEGKGLDFYL